MAFQGKRTPMRNHMCKVIFLEFYLVTYAILGYEIVFIHQFKVSDLQQKTLKVNENLELQ